MPEEKKHFSTKQPRNPGGQFAKGSPVGYVPAKEREGEVKKNVALDGFGPVGRTGLNRWGGRITEEWLKDLQGAKGIRMYREMAEGDPSVAAGLYVIRSMAEGVDWSVEECETPTAPADAEFLESCVYDMGRGMSDAVDEGLSMLEFGWALLEIVYKVRGGHKPEDSLNHSQYSDGRIGWSSFALRGQETLDRWEIDESGSILGMWQSAALGAEPVFIPIQKSILFRTTKRKNNPEGRSLLRAAYKPYYRKKNLEMFEGIGAERDLAGYPVLEVPPEVLTPNPPPEIAAMKASLQDIVTQVRRDEREGLLIPNETSGFRFKLLSAPGSRQFNTNEIIDRCNREIMFAMLTDFLLIGHEAVGSFALNTSKVGLFLTSLQALIKKLEQSINEYAVPQLFLVNGMAREEYPKMRAGKVHARDVVEKISALKDLAGAGLLPSGPEMMGDLLNTVMRDLGLPEFDTDEWELQAAQMQIPFPIG